MRRLKSELTLDQYVSSAMSSNQFAGKADELFKLKQGLMGEVGGLFSGIKKASRDALTDAEAVVAAEEIGDSLWYLFAVAKQQRIKMPALIAATLAEIAEVLGVSPPQGRAGEASFRRVTGFVNTSKSSARPGEKVALQRLAERVGSLVASPSATLTSVAGVLADLGLLAHSLSLDLEEIALQNIEKVNARWPKGRATPTPLFDAESPIGEQLPRRIWVRFEEKEVGTVKYVYISVNGVNVGDRLTDNSHTADDYRFHDVFHLAYAAYLGWSPVLRALLKKKRKSSSATDENEDGARAIIIEEGISTWMFNLGRDHRLFEGVKAEAFSYSLLKQVQSLVNGYEVDQCQPWEWANAILRGFEVFRKLKTKRGGYVLADLQARKITYKGLHEVDERIEYKEVRRSTGKSKPRKRVQSVRKRVRAS